MLLEQKGKNLIVITFPVKRAPGPLAAFLRLFPLSARPPPPPLVHPACQHFLALRQRLLYFWISSPHKKSPLMQLQVPASRGPFV